MSFKRNVRNASIVGAILTGGIAVTTLFCTKKNSNSGTGFETSNSDSNNGPGSWTISATAKNIVFTVNSCIKNHVIYCEYEITKYDASGNNLGMYSSLSAGNCKSNFIQINDANPCYLNQGNLGDEGGQANYYKFQKATCYDTNASNAELTLTNELPSQIDCQ